MNERGGVVGFMGVGGLVALLGMLLSFAPAPQRAAGPAPEPSPSPSPTPPPDVGTGRRLLEAFFSDGDAAEPDLRRAAERYELRVVVATLPDPVDTHLDWLFDSNLDALKRAFERAGYVIDGFWLPWTRDDRPVPAFASPVPRRDDRPGVMLFRDSSAIAEGRKARLALLYVVGESPTGGVHKRALRAALQERYDLLTGPFGADAEPVVKLLAPVFSGSSESLRHVLTGWTQSTGETFELRSGTATSPGNRETLHEPLVGRDFAATVHSDASLLQVFCERVVKPLGLADEQVAVLKEATTQYGQSEGTPWRCGTDPESGFLMLPFPMNISGLRAVYPAQPSAAQARDKPGGATAEAPRLPLSLTDPLRPRENAPTFSEITAPSVDLEFDALARVIVHQQVRVVCILATDVRDTLFLASEVRRRARDVQLATFESNDLYLRPEYADALRGMLVLSTYPLLGPEVRRFRGERVSFASGGAQGTYNAALALLDLPGALVDYRRPGAGGEEARAPVWITAVGRGRLLPLAVEAPEDAYVLGVERARREAAPARRDDARLAPLSFGLTVLFGIALLVVAPLVARQPDATLPPAPAPAAPHRVLRRYVEGLSLVLHPHIYAALALLALASLYLPLALVVARRQRWDRLLTLFCASVGAWVVWLFARSAWRAARLAFDTRAAGWRYAVAVRWPTRTQQGLWGLEVAARTSVSLAGLVYAGLLAWFLAWIVALDRWPFRFFALRALQLDGGVSPLLPLLCGAAGFACWSVWHLLRIRALQTPGDYERCLAARAASDGAKVRAVRERLFLAVPEPAAVGVLAALSIVAGWLALRFGGTIESIVAGQRCTPFDALLRVVVLAGVCTTAWGVCRLVLVWRALRACLETLGRTPLATACARLPEAVPSLARLTPWSDARDAIRSVAASHLGLLRRLYPADDGPLVDALGARLRGRLALAMRGRSGHSDADKKQLAPVCVLLVLRRALGAVWASEPMEAQRARLEPALEKMERDAATSDKTRLTFAGPAGLWLRAAEEYVAIQAAGYIESVLRHLRVLAAFLLLSLVLTTVMLSSYPFQPQGLVKLCFSFVLAAAVVALVGVTSDMNRNATLSRMSRTAPGRLTWDVGYVLNLALFAVAPLLTLVGSEFPWVRGVFFAWVDPLLRALTKS